MDRRNQTRIVASLQARQLGLVADHQCRARHVTTDYLYQEVRSGRMRRVGRGVFSASSAAESYEWRLLAVVLEAAGASGIAAGSHASAAYVLGLPLPGPRHPPIEATTRLGRQPRIEGVRLHRSGLFFDDDIKHVGPVPITIAARTVVDLSMRLTPGQLGRLLDEALRRKLTTLGAVQRQAHRLRSAPGRSQRRVLDLVVARSGEDASESDLELFAIDALKRFGVRLPTQQHPVQARGGRKRRVDLCYSLERKAIEALGYEYHGLRTKFDADAVRGNELALAGYTPMYVTSAMTDWDVAALVAEAIGDPVPPGPPRQLTFRAWYNRRYK
jgi:hypothetical protein